MTIKRYIKEAGWNISCELPRIVRKVDVDVSFVNTDGSKDETQFTLSEYGTNAATEELNTLFADFCKDEHIKANTVTSVTIVGAYEEAV